MINLFCKLKLRDGVLKGGGIFEVSSLILHGEYIRFEIMV
jgi:hypothetical protein